ARRDYQQQRKERDQQAVGGADADNSRHHSRRILDRVCHFAGPHTLFSGLVLYCSWLANGVEAMHAGAELVAGTPAICRACATASFSLNRNAALVMNVVTNERE